jgi:hypothetical protein
MWYSVDNKYQIASCANVVIVFKMVNLEGVRMNRADFQSLSREVLIKLCEMYVKNWMSVDGLWFQGVEDKYGLDAAVELDLRMWQRQSVLEARRIKETLNLVDSDIPTILTVIDYMTWSRAYTFEVEEVTQDQAIIYYPHCLPQEARTKQGRAEFPCQPTGFPVFELPAKLINPTAKIECIFCPPGPHPPDCWCKWRITIQTQSNGGTLH